MSYMKYVLGFIFDEERKNVLLLKRSPNHKRQSNLFNGVGGKVEQSDCCYKATMVRESLEEIGFSPEVWEETVYLSGPGWCIYVFRATADLSKAIAMEEDEVHIVPLDNIPNNCVEDVDWLLRMNTSKEIDFCTPIVINRLT